MCSEYKTESIPATGIHRLKLVSRKEATCCKEGIIIKACTVCGASVSEKIPVNLNNHDWSDIVTITQKPTIFKKGKGEICCCNCGAKKEKSIDKLKAKVSLVCKAKTMSIGENYKIKIKKKSKGDKIAKYYSSNSKVASVNSKGQIIAKKKGTAKITLKMKSGCKAVCKIKVK